MSDSDTLNVWHEQRLVGQLGRNTTGAIGFRYDPAWITGGGFAVSRSLPLAVREFAPEAGTAQRWFANLLPEGAVREHIVRDLKLPNTDFGLLRAIGGECAGALSILPVDRQPSGQRQYRPLTEKDLADLAARRGQIYAVRPADERPRLSLAGAQDKCPLLLRDDQYFLPQGEAPSSHILKFELADTTRLAAAIGLPVVDITLRTVGRTRYAQIAGYDRVWDESGEVQRLHQEDFCQALGYGHEKKYQEHGGPSFAQCYRLVQEASSEPAIDMQHLLRWQIFTIVIGAGALGCASAIAIRRRLGAGQGVLLLEKSALCSGVSSDHSGIFRAANANAQAVHMAVLAERAWRTLGELWGAEVPLQRNGAIWIADDTVAEAWHSVAAQCRAQGVVFEEVEPQQAVQLAGGAIRTADGELCFHEPGAFQFQPADLRDALAQALKLNGVECRERLAVRGLIFASDGRVEGVSTDAGEFGCEHLVDAAGAWATSLLAQHELAVPVRLESVFVGNWRTGPRALTPKLPVIADFVNRIYFRCWPGGRLHLHRPRSRSGPRLEPPYASGEPIGTDTEYDDYASEPRPDREDAVRDYEARIRNRFADLGDIALGDGRFRYFDVTPDLQFVLGADDRVTNLYHCLGGGQAIKYAPLFGELIGGLVTGRPAAPGLDLAPFSVRRLREIAARPAPVAGAAGSL